MTVKEAYQKYQIMPQLQRHMLEVAGVGKIILEHWQGKSLNADVILDSMLFHDMGNIIKFNLNVMPDTRDHEKYDVSAWEIIQTEIRKKYGQDEYQGTFAINEEIGVRSEAIAVIKRQHKLQNYADMLDTDDWPVKLLTYADMRVAPSGVVSLQKRVDDLLHRYGVDQNQFDYLWPLEKQIVTMTGKQVKSIDEAMVEKYFAEFLGRSV